MSLSEPKFKFNLSGNQYTVTPQGEDTLDLQYSPDHSYVLFGGLLCITLSIVFYAFHVPVGGSLLLGIFILLVILTTIIHSEFSCTMDRRTGKISYYRGGLFGIRAFEKRSEHKMQDIAGLEVSRYFSRNLDKFQIHLYFKDGNIIALSPANLGFVSQQHYFSIFQKFLGPDVSTRIAEGGGYGSW